MAAMDLPSLAGKIEPVLLNIPSRPNPLLSMQATRFCRIPNYYYEKYMSQLRRDVSSHSLAAGTI